MSEAAKPKDPRTVILRKVRLSFTDGIKTKQQTNKDDPEAPFKYNFNIIVETSGEGAKYSAENQAKIKAALEAAGEKAFKDKNAYISIAEDAPKRVCYREGKRFKNKEGKVYAGYEGNFAFGVTGPKAGQKRPVLRDKYKREVAEADIEEVFYGGSYADVIVSFFGTEKGSRGIFATCELVRSHQDGEPMGGGYVFSADDLDELDDLGDADDDLDNLSGDTGSSAAAEDDLLG